MGKGEAQLSDREEEKGEEIEGAEKGKSGVRQEQRGKDGEREREGEKGTSGAGKEKGKGAEREMQEERWQERKDEVLGEFRGMSAASAPQLSHPAARSRAPRTSAGPGSPAGCGERRGRREAAGKGKRSSSY